VLQAAPVLANLRNLAVAEHRAATDNLTGLPNQRSVQEALDRMVAQAKRQDADLAAIVIDLDHFKALNDRYGRQVGDEALASAATLLCRHVRDADFVGRWGGVPAAGSRHGRGWWGSPREELRASLEGSSWPARRPA
jgi:GGDEF domain-containing protein